MLGNSPSSGIGIGEREQIDKKSKMQIPGPGFYPVEPKAKEGPKFKFGTSTRTNFVHHVTPGPGNYKIPSTIAV